MASYLPALFAFVAAVVGVFGAPKWDATRRGLRRVTPLGWAALLVAAGSLVAAALVTHRASAVAEADAQQRRRVRSVAHAEARLAIRVVTDPFFVLFRDDKDEASEIELVPAHVLDPARLGEVEKIDTRTAWSDFTPGPYDPARSPALGWSVVLKEHAERGAARIDRVLQIYASYLEPETIWLLSRLRTTEFLVLRLGHIDELVSDNRHVSFLPFPFVEGLPSPAVQDDRFGYFEFWRTVKDLDVKLEKDPGMLKHRL